MEKEKNDFNRTNLNINIQNKKEKDSKDSKDSNETSNLERYELMTTNFLFSIMIILTTIGTFLIIMKLDEFLLPLKEINPNYEFPSIYDFKITLITIPLVIVRILKYKIKRIFIFFIQIYIKNDRNFCLQNFQNSKIKKYLSKNYKPKKLFYLNFSTSKSQSKNLLILYSVNIQKKNI